MSGQNQDTFTEVTSESWGSRLGNSLKSLVLGVIFFVAAFPVLWINEGRAVNTAEAIERGESSCVAANSEKVDAANDGKLVHMTGEARTDETLSDPEFGVTAPAIRLIRDVEMFQWKQKSESETKTKLGGGTETTTKYNYEKVWSKELLSSKDYKLAGHDNPATLPYENKAYTAKKVTIGAFTMPPLLVNRMTQDEAFPLTSAALYLITPEIKELYGLPMEMPKGEAPGKTDAAKSAEPVAKSLAVAGKTEAPKTAEAPAKTEEPKPAAAKSRFKCAKGSFYIGDNPDAPAIGDIRISFKVVKPAAVSLLARQFKDTLEDYKDPKNSTSLTRLEYGTQSKETMFRLARDENNMMTWLLRIGGFLLMTIGLAMVFKPLVTLADVLPFLGNLLEAGVGIVAGLVSLCLSLITIAIAWIAYRPALGITILVIGAISVAAVFFLKKKAPAAMQTIPGPQR